MELEGKSFVTLQANLKELYEKVEVLIKEDSDPESVRELLDNVNEASSQLEKAIRLHDDSSKGEFLITQLYNLHSEKACFDKKVSEWLQKKLPVDPETSATAASVVSASHGSQLRTASGSSWSSRSSRSSRSSLRLAKAVAKQEVARLHIRQLQEQRLLEQQREQEQRLLEKKEFELKQQREQEQRLLEQQRERKAREIEHQREVLKASHQLQKAAVERQVFEEELERGGYIPFDDQKPTTSADVTVVTSQTEQVHLPFTGVDSAAQTVALPDHSLPLETKPKVTFQGSTQLDSSMREDMKPQAESRLRKPALELLKFDGNPLTYLKFISAFESTIEAVEHDDNVKLLYLIQYCSGKAKSIIEYCLLLEPHQGFVKAKQILYETYGKRNVIARSYIANLLEGPSVKKNDSEALIELARKVEECYTTLGHLNYFSDLNCFENISKIVRRLPFDLQSRWLRISAGVEREGREPDFADLKRFIVNEADVVKSSYANSLNFKLKPGSVFGVNTHYTVASNSTKAINTYECKFCRSLKHVLWKCPEFSEISVKERLRFMHQRHLCYNCGKTGHISKYCYSEAACTKNGCKQKHHLLLHQERRDVSPSKDKPCPSSIEQARNLPTNTKPHSTNFLAASNITVGSNVFLNVVPVYVETGSKSVLTCAFLDQGSTTSLCANRLLNLLDISGEPTKFSVTTVTDCSTLRKGEKVNLTVRSLTGDEINLQNVLSVDQLLVVPNPALTHHEFEAWPHLQDLDLPAAHGEVLLLIGLDTPEAFWVKEERRGSAKEPYAVRGVLGWSVVGPRTTAQGNLSEGDDSISVNFLNTSDDLLDSQIQCLWRLDEVPKCNDNVTSMSREDRYALQQMQRTKNVIRGHYQVGLSGAPCLPDNCSQARAQLSRLRGRLVKDPALKEKYSKVDVSLRNSFGGYLSESVFWTDSMTVLYMIRNSAKRFPVFVSNRLAQIEDRSTSSQWRFVPSSENPADDGTRPSCSVNRWLTGPSFLQEPESLWPQPPHSLPDLPAEFEIVKQTVAGTEVAVSDGDMEERFARFSSFYRLKRTVAQILRLKGRLLRRPVPTGPLTVDEMHQAEMTVIAAVQREAFPKDYRRLETQNSPGKIVKLSLQKLNPIHVAGVLRVGGRLRNAPLDFDAKHPIIMPANSQVTRLLIEQCHKDVGHSGSSHTWSVLRERYWILKGAATVRKILGKCIFCQRRNSAFGKQYMADLPSCRVTPGNPPFFFTGIDYFGPIMVKQGRSLKDLDQSTISDHLNRKEIRWRFNPPYASHMGGIWERVIRSIKRVLSAICSEQALTDDVLLTLFAEAEHIVNSRPLTPVVLDHEGGVPLSPNHLLLLCAEDHSIGTFNHRDNYVRRRWRQVQYLTDQFWLRWRKEYLQTLQTRQKWQDVEPNFAVDDLVLVSDENSTRGKWPLGRVVQTFPDKFGHVRQVLVRTQNKTLKRSITKLCKLDR